MSLTAEEKYHADRMAEKAEARQARERIEQTEALRRQALGRKVIER